MGSSSDQEKEHSCFHEWMIQQEQDLSDLLQAQHLKCCPNRTPNDTRRNLRDLVDNNIFHFQAYSERRVRLAREDASPFFTPTWCSTFERSLLWLAGCRPTLFIRLIYALCGLQMESQLLQFLEGKNTGHNLDQLSATQLTSVNDLQMRTIQEEERLSRHMATLQERIGDQPFAAMANGSSSGCSEPPIRKVDEAMDEHEQSMVNILEAADRLRLKTLKELITILTPAQAVNFLAASKKLHLCIHEWGKKRDRVHGRKAN